MEYENFGFLIIKFVNSFKFVPLTIKSIGKNSTCWYYHK